LGIIHGNLYQTLIANHPGVPGTEKQVFEKLIAVNDWISSLPVIPAQAVGDRRKNWKLIP